MRVRTTAAVLALGALLGSTPPRTALQLLTEPAPGDPTAALVGAVALAAWALAGWLLVTTTATAAGHLPGVAGRAAAALARRVAPAAVRRAVEVGLGLAVTGAVLGASPAAAASPSQPLDSASRSAVNLDWGAAPTASASPAAPPTPLPPVAPVPTATATATTTARTGPAPVVVAPGDSLWSIAERRLAAPSDAAVAAAWPAWWAANRDVVGPDPDLLLPGTSLVPPADQP